MASNGSALAIDKQIFNNLKIITVNVNSIIKNQRRASLLNLIKTHKPDIILISETKLNKNHVLGFEKYNIIRSDREDIHTGGGTAIMITKNIKYSSITTTENNKDRILEHTIIQINLKDNKSLFIISVYARCGNQKEFIPEVNKIFASLKDRPDNYYIIVGDLNAKHNW